MPHTSSWCHYSQPAIIYTLWFTRSERLHVWVISGFRSPRGCPLFTQSRASAWFKGRYKQQRKEDKKRRSTNQPATGALKVPAETYSAAEQRKIYTHSILSGAFGLSWGTVKAENIRKWTETYKINNLVDVVWSYDASINPGLIREDKA